MQTRGWLTGDMADGVQRVVLGVAARVANEAGRQDQMQLMRHEPTTGCRPTGGSLLKAGHSRSLAHSGVQHLRECTCT